MIQILGDLIADISMRLPNFPVQARDIHRLSYLEVGPGGACNVAIMAARFGLQVSALGEIGDDSFGLVVREGLKKESVSTQHLVVTQGAKTPVAGVVVDQAGEPAYLGHPGSLQMQSLPAEWLEPIRSATALFADGWAEHDRIPELTLNAFALARENNVPIFFDPGPGNPDVQSDWVLDAIRQSSVILLNRGEGRRITSLQDEDQVLDYLQELGPDLIILKKGPDGLVLAQGEQRVPISGFPVDARDATGAGDSLVGAALFGYLNQFSLKKIGRLANATGAAKVQKLGTGHNMPTMQEVAALLKNVGQTPKDYLIKEN